MSGGGYFDLKEFECRCRDRRCAGKLPHMQMSPLLLQALNRVREEFGEAIIVTSGFRCPAHNEAIKGAVGSKHMLGEAADVAPTSGEKPDLDRLCALCEAEKAFTGLGDGRRKGFVHVDVSARRARRVWDY